MIRSVISTGALTMALVACSIWGCDSLKGPELSISAEPTTIAAGGFEHATITTVVKNEGKAASGVTVEFETELGSFSGSTDLTSIEAVSDSNGVAEIQLWSPDEQGQTRVRATYYDDVSGLEATGQVTIYFGPPQAGNLPVDGKFHLHCPYENLGALRQPMPDINMVCTVSAQTTGDHVVPTSSMNLFFAAEAGVLAAEVDPYYETVEVRYSVRGGNPMPVDVAPMPGEPSRLGNLGEEHNPRDGVVTLLAITEGSESWTDLNGNGVYDESPREPFVDTKEPFLDVNDDGEYTPGVDIFCNACDTNGDGEWTDKNGTFDAQTRIWTQFKVVWTGELEEDRAEGNEAGYLATEPAIPNIPDGGQMDLYIYLRDKNMNPVAFFGDNGDYLELTDSSGYLAFVPDYYIDLKNETGIDFYPTTWAVKAFIPEAGVVQMSVLDGYSGDTYPEENYTLSVSYYYTPGPGADGYFLDQRQGWFTQTIRGMVD